MSTVTIIRKQVQETAQQVVNGNTILYSYNYQENEQPTLIGFSVIRGVSGDANYTGNVLITGSVRNGNFDVKNQSYQPEDAALYDVIHTTCQGILNPTNEIVE
ncbi:hypothetical protein [Tenacibaculum aestuarii]|uniref:hypothetical protein n=1 Tax=Tenacibaculum aestuarii TaxID=362781 RepID=UPI0038933055